MADDAGDQEAEAPSKVRAAAVHDRQLDPAKPFLQRPARRVAGKQRSDLGTLPREELVHFRCARSHQGGAGRLRREEHDAAVRATKGSHRPAQQQDVPEGPRPDDERAPLAA